MSFTDKELIAIGVYLAHQRGKADKLRKQPPEFKEWIPENKGEEEGDNEEEEEEEETQKETKHVDDDGFVTVTKGKQLTLADVKPKKEKITEVKQEEKEGEPEEKEIDLAATGKPYVEEDNKDGFVQVDGNEEGIVLAKISEQEAGGEEANTNVQGIVEEDSDDEDDGKGWINPDNISKTLYKGTKKEDRIQEIGVVIMTSDFAMQVRSFCTKDD